MKLAASGVRTGQLKRLLVTRSVALLLGLSLVCLGFVSVVKRLESQQAQLVFDADSIELAQAFESQTLEAARYASLGRNTEAERDWCEADRSLASLRSSATSVTELAVWEKLRDDSATLRKAPRDDAAIERLIVAAKQHQQINSSQMEETRSRGEALQGKVKGLTAALLACAALFVVGSEWLVWRRIFVPTVEISRASEAIREGDLTARANVSSSDELGELASTFNAMAGTLQDRERGRLDFVAQVAHDLKNPLAFIGATANMLGRNPEHFKPEDNAKWLEKIEGQTKKLESLIGEMTDAAQSETGRLQLNREKFNASDLANELFEYWKENAHSHQFEANIAPNILLYADRLRIERVIGNLLSNAVKYSPLGRTIFLELREDKTDVVWSVRDQGEGLSNEEISRLFVPFSRLERTQKMAQGSGLGLSTIKKIVEAHKGEVKVESQPGQGATFSVKLLKARGA